VDAIVFTSPSTVRHLMPLVEDVREIVDRLSIFCAGPVTASAALEAGLTVTGTSDEPSADAIANLIAAHLSPRTSNKEHKLDWPQAESELLVKGISAR
jgi:uroporphyrinogen III methyltransferase/synthase